MLVRGVFRHQYVLKFKNVWNWSRFLIMTPPLTSKLDWSYPTSNFPEMPAIILLFWPYLSHFKLDSENVLSKIGLSNYYNLSVYQTRLQLVSQKKCGLQLWPCLCHFKSDFDGVKYKSKAGLLNLCNLTS